MMDRLMSETCSSQRTRAGPQWAHGRRPIRSGLPFRSRRQVRRERGFTSPARPGPTGLDITWASGCESAVAALLLQPAHAHLAPAHHALDDPEHRLHRLLAKSIQRSPGFRRQPMRRPVDRVVGLRRATRIAIHDAAPRRRPRARETARASGHGARRAIAQPAPGHSRTTFSRPPRPPHRARRLAAPDATGRIRWHAKAQRLPIADTAFSPGGKPGAAKHPVGVTAPRRAPQAGRIRA